MTDPDPNTPRSSAVGDDLGLGLQVPGGGTVDEAGRRRVHPVTPVVQAVSSIPVLGIIVFTFGMGGFARLGSIGLLGAVVLVAVGAALIAAWKYLAWRDTWYWFDADGDFRVDSGVLTRQQRRVQLSRLQSVDVVQPLFARFFSMAELSIEVAGTSDSRVRLQFLPLQDARDLRSEVLARAAGLRHDVGEAPEVAIVTVAPRDLAVSLLLRSTTAGLLLLTALIVVTTVLTSGWGGLGIAMLTGGLPILVVVTEFMKYFNFTVTESPDGLRQRFGLARTETRTVPPGRVQAIEIVEPLLWRRHGWVRLRVNIAGVGSGDSSDSKGETLLIPVATRAVADALIARVLPGLAPERIDWQAAPERSRWRSPIQWQRLAIGWDATVFATRRGRLTRRIAVIPHARTQSVRVTQGPWERRLRLASIHVDSTPGPVKVTGCHLDAGAARAAADAQSVRARLGRVADRSVRWGVGEQ